ncbi:cation:H+ antiporter [Roseivivax halotolerans]|uniref:Cation:H+ antiporter n=1 Tax=Roseivivax halotolerans TaxID=93684 RepID=A0A1I5ZYU9_9RHOB|nr:calcium/sodium antiporter [Roseivivax halotolerans]SFQ61671.1 cation:H+ antiporter [Roseivivax halotolerans]
MDLLLAAAGLAALFFGGDRFVGGSVAIARRFNVSPMVIGLTLVGFGTSLPELVTSLRAAEQGVPGIALGNVVGSNIANILLILGLAALLSPIAVDRIGFRRDGAWLMAATLSALFLAFVPVMGRGLGLAFVAGLAAFLIASFRSGAAPEEAPETDAKLPRAAFDTALGLGLTIAGAVMLVPGATGIARGLGVSETVIGLTLVAVGTSLPELVTSVVAARKGQAEIAFGNVIGSNIFNLFGILGATALYKPLPIDPGIASRDIWVMLAATVALVAVAFAAGRIGRIAGGAALLVYVGYCAAIS